MKNRYHFLLFLLVTGLTLSACSNVERSKTDQARTFLSDSASRSLIEQHIASDPAMRQEMLKRMSERMDVDTLVAAEVCGMMMQRAQADTSLAEHMCSVVAADTMMSRRMANRLFSLPAYQRKRDMRNTPSVSDKTQRLK